MKRSELTLFNRYPGALDWPDVPPELAGLSEVERELLALRAAADLQAEGFRPQKIAEQRLTQPPPDNVVPFARPIGSDA